MPCTTFPIDPALGPVTDIGIAAPASLLKPGDPPPPIHWIKAIADTGCTHTSIFSGAATKAGLQVVGKAPVNSTTQAVTVNVYLGDLFIRCAIGRATPMEFPFRDRAFLELVNGGNSFDALLGMDVMGMGLLSVNGSATSATWCF